ncbi:MAG: amino acid adenylation domain-containing protein [Rhodocyclales bacterium]|nr:amino acid adenylation domain-containing protein [Rhodocyclales bacterium]
MTSTAELLERLRAIDVRLALDGDRLSVNAPKGVLTQELRDELARRKEEVKAFLAAQGSTVATSPSGKLPPVLERVSRAADMPVSHTQQRLWFLKQMDPDSHAYNVPAALRLKGTLDQVALERTLAALVARHESLRTRFLAVDGTPRCAVDKQAVVTLEQLDLSTLPPAEREPAAVRAMEAMTKRPFDISRAPLMHAMLVRIANDSHIALFVFDHIIADGLSLGIFLAEFQELYRRDVTGSGVPLPELPVQYIDYAEWERRAFAQGAIDDHLAFWKRQLAGVPSLLPLPTDHPRPPVQTTHGARSVLQLSPVLSQQIKAFARGEGTTLFIVLLTSFQVLLHRYSGETDLAVGSAIANRGRSEVERVMGYFANNIVLRGDLSGNPTVRELLARTRVTALNAYAHQDMPFDKLVEELSIPRELNHSPLFQVMFVLQNLSLTGFELPGLVCEVMELPVTTARFDLAVDIFDFPQHGLRAYFEYNTDIFDAVTIERMQRHFERLLEAVVAMPEARIGDLPILADEEVQGLLCDWNRTAVEYPREQTVHGLFEQQARSTPDAIALVFEDSELSYRELNGRANRLAHHLRELGVGRETLVGVWMERSADMVVAVLGVLKAGGAYVPLDPAFPRDRLDYMMADAALSVVITEAPMAEEVSGAGLRAVRLDGDADVLARMPADDPAPLAEAGNLAYVIYTSGSTGRPKGVMLEHRSVVNFLLSMHREPGITAQDRFVSVTTLSFDIAGLEIHGPLTVGGTVVLASRATALDGVRLAELVERSAATLLQATPATWRLLLDSGWQGRPGLKMLCGGEGLPRDLADKLLAIPGELWNMYGPTETTIWSTLWRVTDTARPVPIGRPIANTQTYVLEPSGLPAPIGVGGELCIGGDGLARGYRNRDDLTAEKFVTLDLPGVGSTRVYRTGDVVRWLADGRLEFVGRRDHQVKVRGFRIELGEIESVLESHEAVRQAVVVAREAAPGDLRLVAYVAYAPGEDLTVSDVRRHLRRDLPDYMLPSVVVALDAIPLTPNGKVDRAALPDPFRDVQRSDRQYTPPAPGLEQLMAQVWADLLKVERVGADDNFFELGGHSLLSLRVVAAIEKQTGWRMDPRTLFFQTLRQIAAAASARITMDESVKPEGALRG